MFFGGVFYYPRNHDHRGGDFTHLGTEYINFCMFLWFVPTMVGNVVLNRTYIEIAFRRVILLSVDALAPFGLVALKLHLPCSFQRVGNFYCTINQTDTQQCFGKLFCFEQHVLLVLTITWSGKCSSVGYVWIFHFPRTLFYGNVLPCTASDERSVYIPYISHQLLREDDLPQIHVYIFFGYMSFVLGSSFHTASVVLQGISRWWTPGAIIFSKPIFC